MRRGERGSVNHFAKADFRIFKHLFDFDFAPIEADLGIDCFSVLSNYRAIPKRAQMYYRNVSEKVRALSAAIEAARDEAEIFELVTAHYRDCGVGMFGLNRAFRIREAEGGGVEFCAINNIDAVVLDDLIGYELQKHRRCGRTPRPSCRGAAATTCCSTATRAPENPPPSRPS